MQQDHLWTDDYDEVVRWFGSAAQPGSPRASVAAAILQVRLSQEQVHAAQAQVRAAQEATKSARKLVQATWILTAATLAVAIITAYK